jgi:hypothetical protein
VMRGMAQASVARLPHLRVDWAVHRTQTARRCPQEGPGAAAKHAPLRRAYPSSMNDCFTRQILAGYRVWSRRQLSSKSDAL